MNSRFRLGSFLFLAGAAVFVSMLCLSLHSHAAEGEGEGEGEVSSEGEAPVLVTFDDEMLESLVRYHINKPSGDILPEDMLLLTFLDAEELGITSLEGLQYATDLVELRLGFNQISSISPLSTLERLETLKLNDNLISSVAPLAGIVTLSSLDLSNNQIVNLQSLGALTDLSELRLGGNMITNVSVLGRLESLEALWLGHNDIVDITAIGRLTSLTRLFLDANKIKDLTPLIPLRALTALSLSNNSIVNVAPLLQNSGIDSECRVWLLNNPLSEKALCEDIPLMVEWGVPVYFSGFCPSEGEGEVEGAVLEGQAVEGQAVEGDATEGESQEGDSVEGDVEGQVEGEANEGDLEGETEGEPVVSPSGPPVLSGIDPTEGSTAGGTRVLLRATNISDSNGGLISPLFVLFDGIPATIAAAAEVYSATGNPDDPALKPFEISVEAPPHAEGRVGVAIANPHGTSTSLALFTYKAAPKIARIEAIEGPRRGGDIVTIAGTGMYDAIEILFADKKARILSWTDTTVAVRVPPQEKEGAVDVAVTTRWGTDTAYAVYTYKDDAAGCETGAGLVGISPGSGGPKAGDLMLFTLFVAVLIMLNRRTAGVRG